MGEKLSRSHPNIDDMEHNYVMKDVAVKLLTLELAQRA